MSLINQLLQDLDKRHSGQADGAQLPRGTRATAVPTRASMLSPIAWLLAVLVCATAAGLYFLQADSRFASKVHGLMSGLRNTPPVPEKSPIVSEITHAEVEAALMMPVFQLSSELASPPEISRVALSVDTSAVAAHEIRKERAPLPRNGSVSERNATVSTRQREPHREPERAAKSPPEIKVTAVATSIIGAATDAPVSRVADSARRSDDVRAEELEEVVIPADLPVLPIEKRARQLTDYERAENEFRKGVASLRRGRMSGAEKYFRLAIQEDRSHVAARQALMGILIDAGRNADAEEVLIEALNINPRQPGEAMILARLQVERGDLQAAIRTLEGISAYAGSDAGYYSFLAAVFQRASRHEEAATHYRTALALMPRNAIWLMGLGISLRALDERDGAKDAFRRAGLAGTLAPELQAFVVQQYTQLELAAK